MKKIVSVLALSALFSAAIAAPALGGQSPSRVRVKDSPFTDHLVLHFVDFNKGTKFNFQYASDNDVNISGPSSFVHSPASKSVKVTIQSNNQVEDGNPSVALILNGETCALSLTDGPYSYLRFAGSDPVQNPPPKCQGYEVQQIIQEPNLSHTYDLKVVGPDAADM